MKKGIKVAEATSVIKQVKANINQKYTQISRQNAKEVKPAQKQKSAIQVIDLLFKLKNSNQPLPKKIPSYQPKQQILQKNKVLINQKSSINPPIQKQKKQEVNFQIENRNSFVTKVAPNIAIKNSNKVKEQINDRSYLMINGFSKSIQKPTQKLPIKKQSLVIDIIESKEEKDISQYSTQIQSIQPVESISQPQAEVEVKPDQKKKDGYLHIKLSIKNMHEQNVKLNQLYNQIKEANQKINLRLDTYFENYQSLLSFCTKFLRFGPEISCLTWNVKGYFEDDSDSNNIGELISRFSQLYRFEFNIFQSSLSNSAAHSFSNGLKKLIQLQVLRINVYDAYRGVSKDILRRANQYIAQAIQSLPNLQIITSKNKQIQFCSPLPPKVANFTYIYDIDRASKEGYFTSKRQDKDFQSQFNVLTNITLKNESSYGYNEQQSMKDTLKIFQLPYLTRVDQLKDNKKQSNDVSKVITLMRQLAFSKMRNLLQIVSFKIAAQDFLPINPVMVMTDLWID